MKQATEVSTSSIWERGIDLSQAVFRFSSPEWRERYDVLLRERTEALTQFGKQERLEVGPKEDMFSRASKIFTPFVTAGRKLSDHVESLQDAIIRAVIAGKFIAVGYALPRNVTDWPQYLPTDVWSRQVMWDRSEIKGHGLHFVSVRLFYIGNGQEESTSSSAEKPDSPKVGRPSLKQDIVWAYRQLEAKNRIDHKRPMAAHFELIRDYLSESCPDKAGQYKGMSDETIRKQISSLFKKAKA